MPSIGKKRVSNSTPGTVRRSSASSNIAYTSIRSTGSTTGTDAESGNQATGTASGNGNKGVSSASVVQISRSPSKRKYIQEVSQATKEETEFMVLVSSGNVSGVADALKKRTNLDINKPNYDGYTALHMAVNIQNIDIVKLLFTETEAEIELLDVFFYAIKEGDLAMVKEFVDFEIRRSGAPTKDRLGNPIPKMEASQAKQIAIRLLLDSKNAAINSEFDEDITPLMLAAHCGHYDLIKYFFQAGERLEAIADADENQKYGELLTSYVRVHTFQALANPIYISFFCVEFLTVDPILESFKLIAQLRKYSEHEPEVRDEYIKLIEGLEEFAQELLGLCRNNFEVDLTLSQAAGYPASTGHAYPRLAMAVELEQKAFVTHYNSQASLSGKWIKGFEQWKFYSQLQCFMEFGLRIIFLLPISFFLCIHCKFMTVGTDLYQKLKAPVSCFLHDLASSFFFIMLLISDSAIMYALDLFDANDKSPPRKSISHLIIEILLMVFVLGQIVSTLTHLFYSGKSFFKQMWNVYEILVQILFIAAFSFAFLAWNNAPPEDNILEGEFGSRKYWPEYEPLLVAEAFYIIGVIMSFGRLFRILQLSPTYGPLQVALSKMLLSIAKAFVLYLVVIFSFSSGMCMIYKAYGDTEEWHDRDPETGELTSVQSTAYTSFGSAVQTLFWGILGMAGLENTDIIKLHEKTPEGEEIELHHIWNQTAGRILFAVFHIFATTVLLNTIVAMMTGSAEDIFSNMQMEWKFGRTKVWMFYANGTKYPVPFNTLAIFQHKCFRRKKVLTALELKNEKHARTNYSILVKDLIQRYFHAKESISLDGPVTRDQVDKLKEAVAHTKEVHRVVINRRKISPAVLRFMELKKLKPNRSGDT